MVAVTKMEWKVCQVILVEKTFMVHYCLKFLEQYLWRYFERKIGVIWRKICCLL